MNINNNLDNCNCFEDFLPKAIVITNNTNYPEENSIKFILFSEVFVKILSFLENDLQSLNNCMAVCKYWNNVIKHELFGRGRFWTLSWQDEFVENWRSCFKDTNKDQLVLFHSMKESAKTIFDYYCLKFYSYFIVIQFIQDVQKCSEYDAFIDKFRSKSSNNTFIYFMIHELYVPRGPQDRKISARLDSMILDAGCAKEIIIDNSYNKNNCLHELSKFFLKMGKFEIALDFLSEIIRSGHRCDTKLLYQIFSDCINNREVNTAHKLMLKLSRTSLVTRMDLAGIALKIIGNFIENDLLVSEELWNDAFEIIFKDKISCKIL
ncbi:MAG: F-box protein [Simkaniaceae bacterium]